MKVADFKHLEDIEEYPNTSEITHSWVVPSEDELRGSAVRLLRLAALRDDIPRDEADAFARGALAITAVGRLALTVLEGGAHATRALVELAALMSQRHQNENVDDQEVRRG